MYRNEVMKGGNMAGEIIAVPIKRPTSVGAFCLFIGWSIKEFNRNFEKLEALVADGGVDENSTELELLYGYSLIKELITMDMDESALKARRR